MVQGNSCSLPCQGNLQTLQRLPWHAPVNALHVFQASSVFLRCLLVTFLSALRRSFALSCFVAAQIISQTTQECSGYKTAGQGLRPAAPTLAESKVTAQAGDGGGTPAVMDDAQKTVLVQAEVKRMKGLPATSTYATHRLKVLDKMLQLLSKVRRSCG